jgi:hypothetical protein
MHILRHKYLWALLVSVAVHAGIVGYVGLEDQARSKKNEPEQSKAQVVYLELPPPSPVALKPKPQKHADRLLPAPPPLEPIVPDLPSARTETERRPARMEAPPAPSAEEWAIAGTYKLKNSKRYRYNWGQQVRSMMGTAIEGPDQGVVRFRIEIAPDGSIVSVQTLWTTSETAEKLAREAIAKMPPLPPTPTGKPLIFEQTISFQPFAAGGPPTYQDDCLPDPPVYRNRFAWDGKSAKTQADAPKREKPDPEALAECLKQLPPDTVESVSAHNQRQFDQWRSKSLGH